MIELALAVIGGYTVAAILVAVVVAIAGSALRRRVPRDLPPFPPTVEAMRLRVVSEEVPAAALHTPGRVTARRARSVPDHR